MSTYGDGIAAVDRSGMKDGFVVLVSMYLIGMGLLALRGFLLKKQAAQAGGAEAYLQYHFLAGSSFGPVVIFLNFCAQYVGGIVMVQTPDDTRNLGFWMLMWISGCSWCGATFNIVQARQRETMRGRNYVSPNDYLTDRYKNFMVTFFGVLCSTFQMLFIAGLEWRALRTVMMTILGVGKSDSGSSSNVVVWCMGYFIFACECAGGMASVALTDAIQAGLLLTSFIMLPILCETYYGGFSGAGGYDCINKQIAANFGPYDLATGQFGSPWLYFGTDTCYTAVHEVDMANNCATAHPLGASLEAMDVEPDTYSLPRGYWDGFAYDEGLNRNFLWSDDENEYQKAVGQKRTHYNVERGYQELCSFAKNATYTSTQCPPIGSSYRNVLNATGSLPTGILPSQATTVTHGGLVGGAAQILVPHDRLEMVCANGACNYVIQNTGDLDCYDNGDPSTGTKYTDLDDVPDINVAPVIDVDTEEITGYTVLSAGVCNDTWLDNRTWAKYTYYGEVTLPDGTKGFTQNAMRITQIGCSGINQISSWHWKFPQREIVCYMFSFGFMWIAFAMSPITLSRTMTAKSANAVRDGITVLHLFPLLFFLPVILLGATASGLWPMEPANMSVLGLTAFKLAEATSFGALISVIALVSAMACFMSTADSVVICCSVLFTVDFWHHLVRKNQGAIWELNLFKLLFSFLFITASICIALYSPLNIIEMLQIGNGILGSLVPVYMGMFFHKFRSLEVFMAMCVNFAVVISFQCARYFPPDWVGECAQCAIDGNPHGGTSREQPGFLPPLGGGDPRETYLHLLPPFWGLVFCIPATFVFHFLVRNQEWAHQWFESKAGLPVECVSTFGKERLDLDRTGKITAELMEGVGEPVTNMYAWPFILFPFFVPWWFLPMWEPVGSSTKAVGGMPEWGHTFTIVNSFGTLSLMIACGYFWRGRPGEGEGASFGGLGDEKKKHSITKSTMFAGQGAQITPVDDATAAAIAETNTVQAVTPGELAAEADKAEAEKAAAVAAAETGAE